MKSKLKIVLCAALAAVSLSGCQTLTEKPSEDTPVALRAAFVNTCPDVGDSSETAVEGLGGLLGADLIIKGVTSLVSFANDQLQKAAKEDAEAFTLSSSSPEYLLGINEKTNKQGVRCLIIAAGPTKPGANICDNPFLDKKNPDGSDVWGGVKDNWCGETASVNSLWEKWGFEDIHLLAQVEFAMVKRGAPSYRIPQVRKIYYPKSLSGRPSDKIKGLAMEISATDATDPKNSQILSVRLDGKGIVPSLTSQQSIPLSDKWVVITAQPKGELVDKQALSRPVNLKITVTETPRPNWLLQKAAQLAADKEAKVAEELSKAAVQQWVPEERAKAARDAASVDRSVKLALAGLCDTMYTKGNALEAAKVAKPIENPVSTTAAELDKKKRENAVQVATINYAQAEADAKSAWEAAGKTTALCTGTY